MAFHKKASGSVNYAKKLRDPRWQKKRLEIFQRDDFCCQNCGDKDTTLHVHHKVYGHGDPWDVPLQNLVTLCECCHEEETYERYETENRLLKALKKAGLFTSHLEDIIEYYASQSQYFDLLSDERWQVREHELLNKGGACFICNARCDLVVHHKYPNIYFKLPWELSDNDIYLICKSCNRKERNNISDEFELLSTLRWAGFYREDISDLASRFNLKSLKNEIRRYRKEGIYECFLDSVIEEEENITYEQLLQLDKEIESNGLKLVVLEKKGKNNLQDE